MERDQKMEKEERVKEILCKRCKNTYSPSSNTSSSCRFHSSFFVCRRHDDQVRYPNNHSFFSVYVNLMDEHFHLSSEHTNVESKPHKWLQKKVTQQEGDFTTRVVAVVSQRMWQPSMSWYYELGPDDPPYAAKFYDCCGAEQPEAPGCSTSFHVSYDDD